MTKIINSKYLKKGNHLVLLYESTDEMIYIISEYIIKSLMNNEKCFYIDSLNEKKEIIKNLSDRIDIQRYIEKRQLLFLDKSQAYSETGKFIPNKMIGLLQENALSAIKEGYQGISITGELSWVLEYDDGIERIIEYEWKLNEKVFSDYPVSAICRYHMKHFSDAMLINIIQLHPYVIYKNTINDNPFYLSHEAYKENNIEKYQLKTWLENISNFNSEKDMLNQKIYEKEKQYNALKEEVTENIIISLSRLLEFHDNYTHGHMSNVGTLAKEIAIAMKLDEDSIYTTYYAGLIHDIGKTIIPKIILNKEGPLTANEYDIVKKHPETGYNILNQSRGMTEISKGVLHHHERWDGNGYPEGLSGEEIPIVARILTVADAYDAMTNDRPYRKALDKEQAKIELLRGSNKQFDSNIVEALLAIIKT